MPPLIPPPNEKTPDLIHHPRIQWEHLDGLADAPGLGTHELAIRLVGDDDIGVACLVDVVLGDLRGLGATGLLRRKDALLLKRSEMQ